MRCHPRSTGIDSGQLISIFASLRKGGEEIARPLFSRGDSINNAIDMARKSKTEKDPEAKRTGRIAGGNDDGDGCVYEEVRRGKTVHVAQIRWRDPDGRARRKRAVRSTEAAAKAQLKALRAKLALEKTLPTADETSLTVREALDTWMAEAKRRGVRATTLKQYMYARRYMEALESRRIIDLRRRDIASTVDASAVRLPNEQHKGGRASKSAKSLPPQSNKRMPRLVHVLLKAALEPHLRMVRENLFPRRSAPKKPKAAKMTVWNADEVRRFLTATEDTRHGLLWRFAIESGMRQGEIIALTWERVRGNKIEVVGTYDRVAKNVGDPKTYDSRRQIKISDDLAAELEARRARRDAPVFPALDGETMLEPRNLQRAFAAAQESVRNKEGDSVVDPLPRLRFHDMRHTCASLLFAVNVHPKVVAERLGHSSIRVTMDTYSHMIDGMQTEAAAILGDVITGRSPTKSPPRRKLRSVA